MNITLQARIARRTDELLRANRRQASLMLCWLLVVQWILAVIIALAWSPSTWTGRAASTHAHVYAAIGLGALITSLPLILTRLRPDAVETSIVIALAQMSWSTLLIHLTGGLIETHFHVFGSLAFLALYRDWRVLVVASLVVVVDHLLRGLLWPESVYGTSNPEWWRLPVHAFWVVFEDVVLLYAVTRSVRDVREIGRRQAVTEQQAAELAEANEELRSSRKAIEKLAEVGQLAASVGHELRNPLAAVRNGLAYVNKKVRDPDHTKLASDPRVFKFLDLMDKELELSSHIIADLLDFARERPPDRRECPLAPLIDEAVALIPPRPNVKVVNEVSHALPIPRLDKEQLRQVFMNLIQNATEAVPAEKQGTVRVRAEGGGAAAWKVHVIDDGAGMSEEVQKKIFQPLFTTKLKGTGLGLAVVAGMMQRHGGSVSVKSAVGTGSTFTIQLPGEEGAA